MLDELADFVGRRAHVAAITRRAMNGEIDFAAALAERVALLKGLPAAVLDEAAGRIRLMPGARPLVATLLNIADGRIGGTITAPIVEGEAKRDTLVVLARQCGVQLAATLAVGDG